MNFVKNDFKKTDKTNFPKNREKQIQKDDIKGLMGTTWDANHLTSFLNRSFYSNKKSPQKQKCTQSSQKRFFSTKTKKKENLDYFFKNLKYDMNSSHIGFTNINPLVANVQISQNRRQPLVDFFNQRAQNLFRKNLYNDKKCQKTIDHIRKLRCDEKSKFKFEANIIKYLHSDPLTNKYEIQKPQKIGFSLQRMKRQINTRYQHGIVGIDNPTHVQTIFYEPPKQKKTFLNRQQPLSKESFLLSRQWKTKRRVDSHQIQQLELKKSGCIRKFRNQNSHRYNIVTNRIIEE